MEYDRMRAKQIDLSLQWRTLARSTTLSMPRNHHTTSTADRNTPTKLRLKRSTWSLVAAAVISVAPNANAAIFGEVISLSPVAARLQVEFASPGLTRDSLSSCVRVVSPPSPDGITAVRGGNLTVSGSGANARIVLTHPEPVFDPIIRVTLQDVCGARLQRTYTLLLPEPIEIARPTAAPPRTTPPPSPAARAPAPAAPPAQRAAAETSTQIWTTVAGESVATIAQAMYPRDAGARQAFINAVIRSNPEIFGEGRHPGATLPSGTALSVPSLAPVAAASTAPTRPAPAPAPAAPRAPATTPGTLTDPAAEPISDRLVVDTGERDALAQTPIDLATADEAQREQHLTAAIDRSIDAQLELLERISRLEEVHLALREQLEVTPHDQQVLVGDDSPAAAPTTTPSPTPVDAAAPPPAVDDERIPERAGPPPQAADASMDWLPWALGGGVLLLLILLWLRQRSGTETPPSKRTLAEHEMTVDGTPAAAVAEPQRDRPRETPAAPPTTAKAAPRPAAAPSPAVEPEETQPPPIPRVMEWEPREATVAAPAGQPKAGATGDFSIPTLQPLEPVEEEAEEHESAVELAEIMMSFGRVQGAAETLEAFIESNPKQALMPWLKLMDVYHGAGMHREFDILATELNKTFNVRAVTWENFHDVSTRGATVESLQHVSARLQETWGTKQCQAYIDMLVRDNRQGTRQGFELGAIDDLLILAGVLEQQLGRYKPDRPATE